MITMNQVKMAGRLTSDPQLRHTSAGVAVGHMRLAVSEKYRSKDGELREEFCFVDFETCHKQADACANNLSKGSAVLVEGRLRQNEWLSEDGEKRSKLQVRADRVHFLDAPSSRPSSADD